MSFHVWSLFIVADYIIGFMYKFDSFSDTVQLVQ